MKKRLFSFVLGALFAVAAAFAAGRSPFDLFAKQRRLELPSIVAYGDFVRVAAVNAMRKEDVDGLCEELGVPVQGEGDDRYFLRADLLRACGEECDPNDGLGVLLKAFLMVRHDK